MGTIQPDPQSDVARGIGLRQRIVLFGWQANGIALPGESEYKPTVGLYLQTAGRFSRGK